jgi:hypothetical protein
VSKATLGAGCAFSGGGSRLVAAMAGAVIVLLTGGRSPNQCADGDGQG